MRVIESILLLPYNILKITWKGFYFLISQVTLGFYSYFVWFFQFLKKLFKKSKKIDELITHYKKRTGQPEILLIIIFIINICLSFYNFLITNVDLTNNTMAKREENEKINARNLYKKYGEYTFSDINLRELKDVNSDTVAWLVVNDTDINYPVVKTNDNKYYLNHYFDKTSNDSGWIFMDYRNNYNDLSNNTIIYGKDKNDKEAFDSLAKVFEDSYAKSSDRIIKLITSYQTYNFKVFSMYITKDAKDVVPDFASGAEYKDFISEIKKKSIKDFKEEIANNDKILSLVTVGDNSQVKVVHAKLME